MSTTTRAVWIRAGQTRSIAWASHVRRFLTALDTQSVLPNLATPMNIFSLSVTRKDSMSWTLTTSISSLSGRQFLDALSTIPDQVLSAFYHGIVGLAEAAVILFGPPRSEALNMEASGFPGAFKLEWDQAGTGEPTHMVPGIARSDMPSSGVAEVDDTPNVIRPTVDCLSYDALRDLAPTPHKRVSSGSVLEGSSVENNPFARKARPSSGEINRLELAEYTKSRIRLPKLKPLLLRSNALKEHDLNGISRVPIVPSASTFKQAPSNSDARPCAVKRVISRLKPLLLKGTKPVAPTSCPSRATVEEPDAAAKFCPPPFVGIRQRCEDEDLPAAPGFGYHDLTRRGRVVPRGRAPLSVQVDGSGATTPESCPSSPSSADFGSSIPGTPTDVLAVYSEVGKLLAEFGRAAPETTSPNSIGDRGSATSRDYGDVDLELEEADKSFAVFFYEDEITSPLYESVYAHLYE